MPMSKTYPVTPPANLPYSTTYVIVPTWNYGALFQAFGPNFKTENHPVKTSDDLDALLADTEFSEALCSGKFRDIMISLG